MELFVHLLALLKPLPIFKIITVILVIHLAYYVIELLDKNIHLKKFLIL